MRILSVIAICLLTVPILASGPGDDVVFENRRITDVLRDFVAAGYDLVYSSDVVRPSRRFSEEPVGDDPIARLRDALERHGLRLKRGQTGRWLVVMGSVPAQRAAPFVGRVVDAHSGTPLRGVRIAVVHSDGAGPGAVYTDANGRFELPVSVRQVQVGHDGYRALELRPARVEELLDIRLAREDRIEEIVVNASRYDLHTDRTAVRRVITAEQINSLPELGDDALRATQHLPGMGSIGLSARPHIRGGAVDETLVLFNNVELLEPFHLKDFQSVFSGLNPSLIRSIEVYTGGFPARYGGRMSGVMDVTPSDDHPELGGELLLSFLTSGVTGYGTVARERGRWAVSARRGNLDLITEEVNPSVGDPSYSDWYGQFKWELDADTELDVGVLVYNDDVLFQDIDERDGTGERARSRYRNTYVWGQASRRFSDATHGHAIVSYGRIKHRRLGYINDAEMDEAIATVQDQRMFDVWSLSGTLGTELSDHVALEMGVQYNYQSGDYRYESDILRGEIAELVGVPTEASHRIYTSPSGASGGAFGSLRYRVGWATFEGGLRWDFQRYLTRGSRDQFSPRLGVRLDLSDRSQLRASVGRYYQAEGIHELQVNDGRSQFQRVQYADHYILGFDHRIGDSWLVRLEAFYKRIEDPKRRFENLFNPLVLVPEVNPDRVEIAPSRAQARGFEASVRYRPRQGLDLWAGYTRTSAEDRVDGDWQPRSWDQTHTVKSGVLWTGEAWSLAAGLTWHSGWKTTDIPLAGDVVEPLPLERNDETLKGFASLDVKLERRWTWPRHSLALYLEVTNAFNRDNVGAIEYEIDVDDDGAYEMLGEEETLLPLVPSLGLEWKFH